LAWSLLFLFKNPCQGEGAASLNKKQRKPIIFIGSILIIGCVIVAASLNAHAIADQLHSWKVLPEPEHLTELYFTGSVKLPVFYMAGGAQAIAFTTHNLEFKTTTYHYVVVEQSIDGTKTNTLLSGSFTLKQGQYYTITKYVNLADLGPRIKVTAELTNTHESIDFLITRQGA
jgi:hypothetical protein